MKINRITIFSIEYNCYNGFYIELLGMDTIHKRFNIDSALFGLGISRDYIQISVLFMTFERKRNHSEV